MKRQQKPEKINKWKMLCNPFGEGNIGIQFKIRKLSQIFWHIHKPHSTIQSTEFQGLPWGLSMAQVGKLNRNREEVFKEKDFFLGILENNLKIASIEIVSFTCAYVQHMWACHHIADLN